MTKYLYFPDSLQPAGTAPDEVDVPYWLPDAPPANSDPDAVVVAEPTGQVWVTRPYSAVELDAGRQAQAGVLQSAYQAAIQANVHYTSQGGMSASYQADERSQQNLLKMLAAFGSAQHTPPGFYWVAADNTPVPLTFADLQGLAAAIAAPAIAAFQQLQALKAAVRAATTMSTIRAVTWPPG